MFVRACLLKLTHTGHVYIPNTYYARAQHHVFKDSRIRCLHGKDNGGAFKNLHFETRFQNMRFQSPKCSCRVNEQAKHIKSFLFLASLNMRTGELSVNTRQLRYLKKWLRYLLLNKKVTRCFTSYKGKVIWLRRSRYLCCFTPTLATFTQQQNTVQSCI